MASNFKWALRVSADARSAVDPEIDSRARRWVRDDLLEVLSQEALDAH